MATTTQSSFSEKHARSPQVAVGRPERPRAGGSSGVIHTVVGERGEVIPSSTLDRLERLDDVVFGALSGDPDALDQARARWREAVRTVEPELLATSIERYRQKAREAWGESNDAPEAGLPKGFVALEILELLAE